MINLPLLNNNIFLSKNDLMNLFENIGLSRSNPYFIVPQNRVSEITNKSDSQRLDLLKEIAGTSVYEEKRRDSLKILEDTSNLSEKKKFFFLSVLLGVHRVQARED